MQNNKQQYQEHDKCYSPSNQVVEVGNARGDVRELAVITLSHYARTGTRSRAAEVDQLSAVETHTAAGGKVVAELHLRRACSDARSGRVGRTLRADVESKCLGVVGVIRSDGGGHCESIYQLVNHSGGQGAVQHWHAQQIPGISRTVSANW